MRSAVGFTILMAFAVPAAASTATQVPVGPRAIALGGAFSAIADDATALYWNPAGLVHVGHQEFTASHADLFGTGIRDDFGALVIPLSSALAAGVDFYHSGFDDGVLGFGENRIDAGFGLELRCGLFAGVNAKLLTRSLELDATSLGSSRGFGFDAGVLYLPAERWRIGLSTQDAFGTRLQEPDGRSQVAYPRTLRLGTSWAARRNALVTGQLDDRWHLGFEGLPLPSVALRLGAQGDRHASDGTTWSAGLGFKLSALRIDWAREFPPTLASTDHFAAALEFNLNPSLVRVERPQVEPLYGSLQKTYAREALGSVRVRNLQDKPIEARVSVFIPEVMDKATERIIQLRPRAVTDVPLTAVLGERVRNMEDDRQVTLQVTATYASRRMNRNEKVSATTTVYKPGAIDWSRGMAQAAAFVTPSDPLIEDVARAAAKTVIEGPAAQFSNRNVALMAAMVDALATIGVAYVSDPQNAFKDVAETPHAVDTIYYPAQTLKRGTGDCDDTTVLLASLLGSVGVPTQFVDAPGHIFLIAGTGLDEVNADGLGVDSTSYVVLDHEVWIPIETTVMAKGFLESWRVGASELNSLEGAPAFVDVTRSQARYEPTLPPGERANVAIDSAKLLARLDTEVQLLAAWREEVFQQRFPGQNLQNLRVSSEAMADMARMHLEGGDPAGARAQLARALTTAPQSAMLHHNLAVVLVGLDSLEAAEQHLRTVLAFGNAPAATWLDLGLVRWLRGDSVTAVDLLARGIQRAGGLAAAQALLSGSQGGGGRDVESGGSNPAVGELLQRAAQRVPGKGASGSAFQSESPRLPVLPSGTRSHNADVPALAMLKSMAWWD